MQGLTKFSQFVATNIKVGLQSSRGLRIVCLNRASSRLPRPGWLQTPKPSLQPSRHLRVPPEARRPLTPQHALDKVPATFSLVYESSIKAYISGLYVSVGVVGVSTTAVLAWRWQQLLPKLSTQDGALFAATAGLALLSLAALCYFARTVVIRIYYCHTSGQFLAVRRTWLGRLRQVTYTSRDVEVKDTQENRKQVADFLIKGRSCYITADNFVSPVYYNAHLGEGDGHPDLGREYVGGPRF